jgi:3,4-dihydroxy-2-butanone 4-phosphate synthase
MPAEKVTPQAVNFMVKYARGLLCMPIIGERLDELNLRILGIAQIIDYRLRHEKLIERVTNLEHRG